MTKHKKTTKNFDYTLIADQLGMVSLTSYSWPTGVVKPVYGHQTFLPISESQKLCNQKDTH